jgi:vancomycin resistance protein YoaR
MQRSSTADPPQVRAAHVGVVEALEPPRRIFPARLLAVGTGILLIAMLALLFGYGAAHQGRVFRGVSVLGKDLGGLSSEEARATLASAGAGYPAGPLIVAGAGRTWSFSSADLGWGVDIDKTAQAAMSVGRDGSLPGNLGTQIGALFGGSQVKPVLKYDGSLVDKAIAGVAAGVDKPAVDSKLVQGNDGRVGITASAHGSAVDRDGLRASLASAMQAAPTSGASVPVAVTVRDVAPKITESALKATEAQALLLTEQPVTLTSGNQTWTITPAKLREMLDLTPAGSSTQLNATLGNNQLASYLQPVAAALKVDPVDAAVIVGKGTVTLREEKAGSDLDAPAAIVAIQKASANTDPAARAVDLPMKSTPADVHAADVQAVYDKANGLVTQGMRLRFRDDGYIMRGSAITGFIDVAPTQGGPGYKLVVDENVLADRIAGVAYNINRPSNDARYRLAGGVPTKIADAKEGYKVKVSSSLQNALKALDSYTGGSKLQVDLDVAVTTPTVPNVDLAGAGNTPDLLGSGQTSYAGSSAERAWNVGLGTRNVDGALIPPGGTFSTVEAIGDLTLAAGFKMGYAIVGSGANITTVPAEAGGICQVATTLFHSVFWSGLPVVERNWHSYWIGLYGLPPSGLQGLDATIAPPEKDFRFKNTTGHWVLIKATADGKTVLFQLYGTKPNWKVSVSGPVITNHVATNPAPITEHSSALPAGKKVLVEHAQDGFDASITRTVTDASGQVIDNWTAKSHYEPAHNRYLIGTGK